MELRCDGEIVSLLEFEGLFGAIVTPVEYCDPITAMSGRQLNGLCFFRSSIIMLSLRKHHEPFKFRRER